MKKITALLLCVLTLPLALFSLGGCGAKQYKITYIITDEEVTYSSLINAGENYSLPEKTKEGYTFDGWYNNADLTGEKVTSYKVTSNVTLYGKWDFTGGIDGISEAGNRFYFDTKEYAINLLDFDYSHLLNDEETAKCTGDKYSMYFEENGYSCEYFFKGYRDITNLKYQSVCVVIDKTRQNLTSDEIREMYWDRVASGIMEEEVLNTAIERKYLENILYEYRIGFYDFYDNYQFFYNVIVFKDEDLMREACDFCALNDCALGIDYNCIIYGNEAISYWEQGDSVKINSAINSIEEIKTGLQEITDILLSL